MPETRDALFVLVAGAGFFVAMYEWVTMIAETMPPKLSSTARTSRLNGGLTDLWMSLSVRMGRHGTQPSKLKDQPGTAVLKYTVRRYSVHISILGCHDRCTSTAVGLCAVDAYGRPRRTVDGCKWLVPHRVEFAQSFRGPAAAPMFSRTHPTNLN